MFFQKQNQPHSCSRGKQKPYVAPIMPTLGWARRPESGTSGAGYDTGRFSSAAAAAAASRAASRAAAAAAVPDRVVSTAVDAVPGSEVSSRKKKRKSNPTEQDTRFNDVADDLGGASILLGFRAHPAASARGTHTSSEANHATDNQEGPAPLPMPVPVPVPATMTDPVLLSDPLDGDNLTSAMQFWRRQIEFFTADSDDVDVRYRKGGKRQNIRVGQVGLRCVHCAHCTHLSKLGLGLGSQMPPNGSVAYPASIWSVYQAVRNWQSKLWRFWLICQDLFESLILYLAGLALKALIA